MKIESNKEAKEKEKRTTHKKEKRKGQHIKKN